ncbi:MAG: hypothetical protein ACRD50_04140 [Candidatus Acidiferrales bacterium]
MKEGNDANIRATLKKAMPPVDAELRRDLWPEMKKRIHQVTPPARAAVPWYDWALAGALGAAVVVFPKIILVLAYHL